jgi:hypothetical protein
VFLFDDALFHHDALFLISSSRAHGLQQVLAVVGRKLNEFDYQIYSSMVLVKKGKQRVFFHFPSEIGPACFCLMF